MLTEIKGIIFHVSPMTVMLAMGFTWMALLCHDNFPRLICQVILAGKSV